MSTGAADEPLAVTPIVAGNLLLETLRSEKVPAAECITLRASDGEVCVSRLLAMALSPVLRAAFSGAFANDADGDRFAVPSHSAANVRFAIDFLAGDESRKIDNDSALPLMALADQLGLWPLKDACESALLGLLATSNAEQLQAVAEQYSLKALRETATELLKAETSALGKCMTSKRALLVERDRLVDEQVRLTKCLTDVDRRLAKVADKTAHEMEMSFKGKIANQTAAPVGDAYPHAAGQTLYVRPNAEAHSWEWNASGVPPPKKRKESTYGSIMEAYEAAPPGSVIKLLAGRHVLSNEDINGDERWPENIACTRKSVQIVADDGLTRDQVLVGMWYYDEFPDTLFDHMGVIGVIGADVRFERITFLVTERYPQGIALFAVHGGGKLWLDDCALMCKNDRALDPRFPQRKDMCCVGRGVRVYEGSSVLISGCVIKDADGAAVMVNPDSDRVVVERSILTCCGRGEDEQCASGEFGAIEIQDGYQGKYPEREGSGDPKWPKHRPKVKILVSDSQIEGNLGPALSYRPYGDQIRQMFPVTDKNDPTHKRARQLAQVFTVERCQIRGNEIDTSVTVERGTGPAPDVVWNRTRRGEGSYEDFGDDPENDSEDDSEDEDDDSNGSADW